MLRVWSVGPEGGEDAEQVGAEHEEVGAPEGEDHKGDGDPAVSGRETVGPDRGEREREVGARRARRTRPRSGCGRSGRRSR